MLKALHVRVRALFCRNVMESELNEELRFHFEHEVEKYTSAGMSPEEARRRARFVFGRQEQVKECCREARGIDILESLFQDIRYSLRIFRKNSSFSIIAVLTLALGIGASTAVFSLVNTILLKPLPYPNASRIVMLWRANSVDSIFGSESFPWQALEFSQLKETATAFQNLGAFKKDDFNLTGSGTPEHLEGVRASAGFFPALGTAPLLGRIFTTEEDKPGGGLVVVLSHRLWKSRFGGDLDVVGRVIDLNGFPCTVIGVMPAEFTLPNGEGMPVGVDLPKYPQLWVPLALPGAPRQAPSDLGVIGELKPNIGLAQVHQDLKVFDRRWLEMFPGWKGWFSQVVPLRQQTVADTQRPLLLLLGAVCVVLLIACSNVAGLTLNRSLSRRKEFTLRGALGAQPGRLVRQLMTENMLLALSGGILGTQIAEASLFLVKRFGPDSIPHLHEAALDPRVFVFALGVTLITGLLFGLVPAFGATRMNLVEALKEGGERSGGSVSAPKIRNALLISQIALAVVLVVAAGLLIRTFYHIVRTNAGFDGTHVVTFQLPLPSSKYTDTGQMAQLYQRVQQRLQATAGVQSVGFASVVAMGGPTDSTDIRIPGIPPPQPGSPTLFVNYLFVSPNYFATIGTPLYHGRDIADGDTLTTMPVTIINSAMARKYWPGEDPVGKHVGVGWTKIPLRTIIGVVANTKQVSLREDPVPAMFVPYTQNEIKTYPNMQAMQYAVRAKGDPADITAGVRQAVNAVDPDLPIANFVPLTTLVDASMTSDRFAMLVLSAKLLSQAEAADREEDKRYGGDRRGEELPEELQRRETRIARIREAKEALEESAREQARKEGKDPEEAKPTAKTQYNFTDPESRILKGADGFVQGYNTQIAVEPAFQLIVGQRVTPAANDKQQLVPLVQTIEQQSGQKPQAVVVDSGYCSEENLKYLEKRRIEGFVATEKQKHAQRNESCKPGPLPIGASRVERMARKLQTKVGAAVYATRKCIEEPAFGQIKQARGFRQFLLRGLEKVRGEWALICMTHNILKFHKIICSG